MRRPRIKRLRLTFSRAIPERSRNRVWESYRRQERFARRYGLPITRGIVWLVLAILMFQLLGAGVLYLQSSGGLSPDL